MYKLPDGNDEIYNKYITHLTKDDILNGVDLNESLSRRLFSLTLSLGGGSIPAKELGGLEFEMDMGVDDWPIGQVTYKKLAFTVANDSVDIEDGMKTGQVVKPVIGLQALDGTNRETTLNVPYGTYLVDSIAKDMTMKNYSCYDWLYYINDIDCDFGGDTYPTTVGHILSTITGKYADKGMIPLSEDHQGDWAEWWYDEIGQPKKYKDYEGPIEEEDDDGIDIDPFEPVDDNFPEDEGSRPNENPGKCCDCEPGQGGGGKPGDDPTPPDDGGGNDPTPPDDGGGNDPTPPDDGPTSGANLIIECSEKNYVFTLGEEAWIRASIPDIEDWEKDLYRIQWWVYGDTHLSSYFDFDVGANDSGYTALDEILILRPKAVSDGTISINVRVHTRKDTTVPFSYTSPDIDPNRSASVRMTIKNNGHIENYTELDGWELSEKGGGIYSSTDVVERHLYSMYSTTNGSFDTYIDGVKNGFSGCSIDGIIPTQYLDKGSNRFGISYIGIKFTRFCSATFKENFFGFSVRGKDYQGKFYWLPDSFADYAPYIDTSSSSGHYPANPEHPHYCVLGNSSAGGLEYKDYEIWEGFPSQGYYKYITYPMEVNSEIFFPNFIKNTGDTHLCGVGIPYYTYYDTPTLYFATSPKISEKQEEIIEEAYYDEDLDRYLITEFEITYYGTKIKSKDFSNPVPGQRDEFFAPAQSLSLMSLSRNLSDPAYNEDGELIVTYAEEPDPNDPSQTPNEDGQVLVTTPEEIGFEMKEGQMLGYIAAYCGGNLVMDHTGEVRLLRLTDNITTDENGKESIDYDKHIPNSQVAIPEIDNCEASSTLGGLIIHTSTYEGDDIKLGNEKPSQTHYVLEIDNPFMTEERATEIFEKMSSLTYFPMRVVILSDPRLWLGDLLYFDGFSQYNEASGVNVEVIREGYYPIMKLVSHYDGAPSLQIEASCSSLSDRSNSFTGTLNDKIDEVSAKVTETNKTVNEMKYEIEEIRALVGYFNELFAIEVNADNIVSATINTKNIRIAPVKGKTEGGLYIDGDSIDFIDNDGVQRLHIGSHGDDKDYFIRFVNENGYTRDLRALDPGPCCCDGGNNNNNGGTDPTPPDDGGGNLEGDLFIELEGDGITRYSKVITGTGKDNITRYKCTYNVTANVGDVIEVKYRLSSTPENDPQEIYVNNKIEAEFIGEPDPVTSIIEPDLHSSDSIDEDVRTEFTSENYNVWQTVKIRVNKYKGLGDTILFTPDQSGSVGYDDIATTLEIKINDPDLINPEGVDKPRIELQVEGVSDIDTIENNPNNHTNRYGIVVNGTQMFNIKCRLVDKPKKVTTIYGMTHFTDNSGFISGPTNAKDITLTFEPDKYNEWQTVPVIVDGNTYYSINFHFGTSTNTGIGTERYAILDVSIK